MPVSSLVLFEWHLSVWYCDGSMTDYFYAARVGLALGVLVIVLLSVAL
jgi:hypothetical protein